MSKKIILTIIASTSIITVVALSKKPHLLTLLIKVPANYCHTMYQQCINRCYDVFGDIVGSQAALNCASFCTEQYHSCNQTIQMLEYDSLITTQTIDIMRQPSDCQERFCVKCPQGCLRFQDEPEKYFACMFACNLSCLLCKLGLETPTNRFPRPQCISAYRACRGLCGQRAGCIQMCNAQYLACIAGFPTQQSIQPPANIPDLNHNNNYESYKSDRSRALSACEEKFCLKCPQECDQRYSQDSTEYRGCRVGCYMACLLCQMGLDYP